MKLFNFKPDIKDAKTQENKPNNRLTVLSYKSAYDRLIRHIHDHYWELGRAKLDFLDKSLQEDKGLKALIIDLRLPQKGKSRHGSWGPEGEQRLMQFLRNIYMIEAYTPFNEGCIPLLKCVEGIIAAKGGHHFPGQLAVAVQESLFQIARLEPHEHTVTLTGELAVQGQAMIEQLNIQARRCDNKYRPDNSSGLSDDAMMMIAALM